jgi:hypothetical protein
MPLAFVSTEAEGLLTRHAPVVLVERPDRAYNRIGTVRARRESDDQERLYVDPAEPKLYAETRRFTTPRGSYTNLIYRMHFEKVPFSLVPFHLTTGRNGGLLVVMTLDESGAPVLVTAVHTCGCYLAFVPTSYLPEEALPEGWGLATQRVYGAQLPGRLALPASPDDDARLQITLASGTHRVVDLAVTSRAAVERTHDVVKVPLLPMTALEAVALDEGTTPFYRESGAAEGYVKGSFKPLELLLMSWWALDLRVGVDKAYAEGTDAGAVFYTSLRPWRRKISDMRDFPTFLRFWGWGL